VSFVRLFFLSLSRGKACEERVRRVSPHVCVCVRTCRQIHYSFTRDRSVAAGASEKSGSCAERYRDLISHAHRGQPQARRRGEGYFSNPSIVDANAGTGITRSSIKPYAQRVHECRRHTQRRMHTRCRESLPRSYRLHKSGTFDACVRKYLSERRFERERSIPVSIRRSRGSSDRIEMQHERSRRSEARPRMTPVRHAFRPRVLRYEASYKASYIAAVGARAPARGAAIKSLLIESFDRTAFERGDASATLPNKNTVNLICPLPTLPRRGSSIDRESKAASAKRHGARMHKASFHARAYLARKAVS